MTQGGEFMSVLYIADKAFQCSLYWQHYSIDRLLFTIVLEYLSRCDWSKRKVSWNKRSRAEGTSW